MTTPNLGPGMRHAAAALRTRADLAGTVAGSIDNALAGMTYQGPAADRFRASAGQHRSDLLQVRSILAQLADALLQGAAQADARAAQAPGGWS